LSHLEEPTTISIKKKTLNEIRNGKISFVVLAAAVNRPQNKYGNSPSGSVIFPLSIIYGNMQIDE